MNVFKSQSVDPEAESFIDPWLVQNDADLCSSDGTCVDLCGSDDPDCGGDTGDGGGGGEGGGATGAPGSGDVTGGCSAGGPVRGRVALILLGLAAYLLWRRRRR